MPRRIRFGIRHILILQFIATIVLACGVAYKRAHDRYWEPRCVRVKCEEYTPARIFPTMNGSVCGEKTAIVYGYFVISRVQPEDEWHQYRPGSWTLDYFQKEKPKLRSITKAQIDKDRLWGHGASYARDGKLNNDKEYHVIGWPD